MVIMHLGYNYNNTYYNLNPNLSVSKVSAFPFYHTLQKSPSMESRSEQINFDFPLYSVKFTRYTGEGYF